MAQRTETTTPKTGVNQSTPETGRAAKNTDFSFAGPRIYLGPNDQKRGLRFGMGFRNGLPPEVISQCAECPAIFELIVIPARINEVRAQMTVKGSAPHQALALIEKYFAKKRSGGD